MFKQQNLYLLKVYCQKEENGFKLGLPFPVLFLAKSKTPVTGWWWWRVLIVVIERDWLGCLWEHHDLNVLRARIKQYWLAGRRNKIFYVCPSDAALTLDNRSTQLPLYHILTAVFATIFPVCWHSQESGILFWRFKDGPHFPQLLLLCHLSSFLLSRTPFPFENRPQLLLFSVLWNADLKYPSHEWYPLFFYTKGFPILLVTVNDFSNKFPARKQL